MKNRGFIWLVFIPLLLGGCWDQREIEKRAYVFAIGMDKAEKDNEFTITYQIINPEFGVLAQGGSTDEPPYEIISFTANDFITSRNLANAVIAKEITYDLQKVIMVSEDLAKDNDFMRWIYDATKDREIRRDNHLIVTKENVLNFLDKNDPKQETRINKYFEFILNRGIETGLIPDAELHRFFQVTEADEGLFLAIYGTTEDVDKEEDEDGDRPEDQILAGQLGIDGDTNETQLVGSAVFKEGKMIGKLSGEETRISVMLNDTLHMSDVLTTFTDPLDESFRIAARVIKDRDNHITMNLNKGPGEIKVTVPLQLEILSDRSMVNYGKDAEKREQLKTHIENQIEEKIAAVIKRTQEEFKAEPFSWGLLARKKFQTSKEYKKFDWMKRYPHMKVNVHVNIRFGKFGRQGKLPEYQNVRD